MPLYSYINDETGEIVELLQTMGEPHEYVFAGVAWRRLFEPPQLAKDMRVDPFSMSKFMDKTSNGGSMGDIWDRASDLSQARAEKAGGIDPISGQAPPKKRSKKVNIEIG